MVEYVKKNGECELRHISGMCYGTLNLAYILALTEALELLLKPCEVTIIADNDHVCQSICNGRVNEWRLNGWKTVRNEPIVNTDEWRNLFKAATRHDLHFIHFSGNSQYSKEIQKDIKEVRDRGEYWKQMQMF